LARKFILFLLLCSATALYAEKLPLVEMPSTKGTSDTLVVFVSGDGGWAAIDKSISKVLTDNGMPVVGLNALQYFWTKRTPDSAARDLQQICDRYLATWKKERLLLIGYSRGADVLPFMTARLSPELKSKIRLVALLGPSPTVQFEFHVADWLHSSPKGMPVKPEVDKLHGHRVLCLFGQDDKESLCPGLHPSSTLNVVMLKGAHHFDGGYEKLAHVILEQLK
jgi:type IV secretory pathway VirJ component